MALTKLDLEVEDLKLSPDMKDLPVIAKYDEAMKQLLSQVFAGEVILAPVDRAFDLYVGQTEGNTIKFPFISLFPAGGYTRINKNFAMSNIGNPVYRQALIRNDDTLEIEGNSTGMQNFYQTMYYNIPYSIECWSSNRIQALQLVQELCFWLQAQGQIIIKYKEHTFNANLQVADDIQDTTSYTSYSDLGNIYRFTLNINIEAPVFRTQNYLNITSTELTLELKDSDNEKED